MFEESNTNIFGLQYVRGYVADAFIDAGEVAKIEYIVEFGRGSRHLLNDKAIDAEHAAGNALDRVFYRGEKRGEPGGNYRRVDALEHRHGGLGEVKDIEQGHESWVDGIPSP